METSGGASIAVGIWYQSMGAASAIINPWIFDGTPGSVHGEGLIKSDKYSLIVEYFDMDAGLFNTEGLKLIQFKVTSQEKPKNFDIGDVREILQNAAQAIIRHNKNDDTPITDFIVATNRGAGRVFSKIQEILKSLQTEKNQTNLKSVFEEKTVPNYFFPPPKKKKADKIPKDAQAPDSEAESIAALGETLRDFAKSVVYGKTEEWGVSVEECTEACLLAMMKFRFAVAKPASLIENLHQWFSTWGILHSEYRNCSEILLSKFLNMSLDGRSTDRISMMREILDAPNAIPIEPKSVWANVVKEIEKWGKKEPPTKHLITEKGIAEWMLDRSDLLNGLPDGLIAPVTQDIDFDSPDDIKGYGNTQQIYAFIGPGSIGKTGLLALLLSKIAGRAWDWEKQVFTSEKDFIGYPIIAATMPNFLDELEGAIKRWGNRESYFNSASSRFGTAGKVPPGKSAVWIGLDGLDEMERNDLRNIARAISNCVNANPNVRLVLTAREEQFEIISSNIETDKLAIPIKVSEFSTAEAYKALARATDGKISFGLRGNTGVSPGERGDDTGLITDIITSEFESSIRQPLFIGVIHNFYKETGDVEVIRQAYKGDSEALVKLSSEYIYVFCERVSRRLNDSYITPKKVFKAIKRLANAVGNPSEATRSDWKNICEDELEDLVKWSIFYIQCNLTGLINKLDAQSGAFEWRHPFIGRELPTMGEKTGWN